MNEGTLTGGRITLAVLLSLLVTGVALAVMVTVLMVAGDLTNGSGIYAGELVSAFFYLLILGTALTVAFGAVPFAGVMLILIRMRAVSALAFALGGAIAGAIAAAAFVLVTASSFAGGIDEMRKLAFEDFAGLAVVISSVLGGLAAWRYLDRAARKPVA